MAELEEGRESEKLRDRLAEDWHERRIQLMDLSLTGRFAISAKSATAIADYMEVIHGLYWEDNPYDQAYIALSAASECMKEVQIEAERELNIEIADLAPKLPSPPRRPADQNSHPAS